MVFICSDTGTSKKWFFSPPLPFLPPFHSFLPHPVLKLWCRDTNRYTCESSESQVSVCVESAPFDSEVGNQMTHSDACLLFLITVILQNMVKASNHDFWSRGGVYLFLIWEAISWNEFVAAVFHSNLK